jgi:indolepyruvate ferredoxin oxidoreductase beta subunit
MTKSVLLVGVGGQGTILASKILTQGLMEAGYDVKMNEIHGMSQRGGSVSSQVRYAQAGEEVESPVIEERSADLLVSFEKMEALRWLPYLGEGGTAIVNDYEIPPMVVLAGKAEYPKGIFEELEKRAPVLRIDAAGSAAALGNPKAMNMILLGTIVKKMNLLDIDWEKIIRENVKPAFADVNARAFREGIKMV